MNPNVRILPVFANFVRQGVVPGMPTRRSTTAFSTLTFLALAFSAVIIHAPALHAQAINTHAEDTLLGDDAPTDDTRTENTRTEDNGTVQNRADDTLSTSASPLVSQTQIDRERPLKGNPLPADLPPLSPQAMADSLRVAQYILPETFLLRATATLRALQIANLSPPDTRGASLDQVIRSVARAPRIAPVLAAHGFTPETFILGITAVNMTLAAQAGSLPPSIPQPNQRNLMLLDRQKTDTDAFLRALRNSAY